MSDDCCRLPNKGIDLPAPAKEIVELDGMTVIRVYPLDDKFNDYPRSELNRNIYAYDSSGKLVWQIQEAPHGGRSEDKAYVSIKIEGDKLIAGNWIGTDYVVDLRTGKVSQATRGIRPW